MSEECVLTGISHFLQLDTTHLFHKSQFQFHSSGTDQFLCLKYRADSNLTENSMLMLPITIQIFLPWEPQNNCLHKQMRHTKNIYNTYLLLEEKKQCISFNCCLHPKLVKEEGNACRASRATWNISLNWAARFFICFIPYMTELQS